VTQAHKTASSRLPVGEQQYKRESRKTRIDVHALILCRRSKPGANRKLPREEVHHTHPHHALLDIQLEVKVVGDDVAEPVLDVKMLGQDWRVASAETRRCLNAGFEARASFQILWIAWHVKFSLSQ
jgi:hypothetical protein